MRYRFGYFAPEAWYQAVVNQIVDENCRWLDVGGGKTIFPDNRKLSVELAQRCKHLVGVDPSETLEQNDLVDERIQVPIEAYRSDDAFDLATLRMVAEHIEHPEQVVQALSRLVENGGFVVIYTPNKWSVSAVLASLIPNRVHAAFARILSPDRKAEDVFPTCYRMNTRKKLRTLFDSSGFEEVGFVYLDDCSLFHTIRVLFFLQLCLWRIFYSLGFTFPENNILGIYKKASSAESVGQN